MSKFISLMRFKIAVSTVIFSVSIIWVAPVFSQEAEEALTPQAEEVDVSVSPSAEKILEAQTTDDSEISTEQLEILLKPLNQQQLMTEADAWYDLLQSKAQEISTLEYGIRLREEEPESTISDAEKEKEVFEITQLQDEQAGLVNRLNIVSDSLEFKGGDPTLYRQYANAVSGIDLKITDTENLGLRFMAWLQSEEGGIKWGIGLLKISGILVGTILISPRLGKLVDASLSRIDSISNLFRGFIVVITKRIVLGVGALIALASVGVSLGPILALAGGLSFILAFALQSNLGNFASGLMLLLYKPFDVDDEVEIAGEWAIVKEITLANTVLQVWKHGRLISIPNSTVWGSTIINRTPKDGIKKFVGRIFVNVNEDLVKAKELVDDVINSHPLVLQEFWHGTFIGKVEESAVMLYIARTKVSDYWTLHEELIIQAHSRLREAGIQFSVPEYHVSFDSVQDRGSYQPLSQNDVKRTQEEMGLDFDPA